MARQPSEDQSAPVGAQLPASFTLVALQRGDGRVRLLLQLQQRDLAGVVAHEGVLRVVIVSGRVRDENTDWCTAEVKKKNTHTNKQTNKQQGYCKQEAQALK